MGVRGVDTKTTSPVVNPHHIIRSNRPKQKSKQDRTTKTDVKQCHESLKSLQRHLKISSKQTVKRTEKNKQEKQKQRRKICNTRHLSYPVLRARIRTKEHKNKLKKSKTPSPEPQQQKMQRENTVLFIIART